jgi:hypothetical protein
VSIPFEYWERIGACAARLRELEALKQAAAPHLHCQECGCDFPQRHAADRRQFCSRACYYASLRGKPPACVPQPTLREYCREMGRRGAARMRELVRAGQAVQERERRAGE